MNMTLVAQLLNMLILSIGLIIFILWAIKTIKNLIKDIKKYSSHLLSYAAGAFEFLG